MIGKPAAVGFFCDSCTLNDDFYKGKLILKLKWKTVLPACAGKCSNAPNKGWITKGQTKQGAKSSAGTKRKPANVISIDLNTFRPRPIEVNFDDWLADSKQAWDQHRFEMRTKRQIKRRRKTLVKM